MAKNFRHFQDGINLVPKSVSTVSIAGDLDFSFSDGRLNLFDNSSASVVVTNLSSDTLYNKTLINPQIATSHNGSGTIAYNSSGAITIPNATDTLVGKATTDTLTNKSIAAGSNTITGLTNSNLSGSAAITNANLATMAANTIKGSTAGGTPSDLTGTQATTILVNMVGDSGSGGTKGLVPAPASGDAAANKFLKADGTWALTTGSGVVSIGVINSQSKSANGAVITGTSLVEQTADASFPGLVSTGTQIFAGAKQFNGTLTTTNIGDVSSGGLNLVPLGNLTLGGGGTSRIILETSVGTSIKALGSTPAAPASGYVAIYPKSNNNIYQQNASGTEIQLTPPISEVFLMGGNGSGSTRTNVRKWTTVVVNTGTAITYVPDVGSGLGDTFTINETGTYALNAVGRYTGAVDLALTRNRVGEFTVAVNSFTGTTDGTILKFSGTAGAANDGTCQTTCRLASGDVIRFQALATDDGGTGNMHNTITITKVNN